jgi:serine/threonine protein kinase
MFLSVSQFQPNQCSPRLRRKSTSWYVAVVTRVMLSLSDGPKRILKGHPNIVHLIDAAWNRTSNGVYEVFILMEYCPGSLHSIGPVTP